MQLVSFEGTPTKKLNGHLQMKLKRQSTNSPSYYLLQLLNKMSTRSGTIYAKTFAPFAKKTKIHHEMPIQLPINADDDSSSDYSDCDTPKYEVNIDFDEASAAWRSNKRRVGESWVYIKPIVHTDSIASRVKKYHSGK